MLYTIYMKNKSFSQKWKDFFGTMLSPGTTLFGIATALLLALSFVFSKDIYISIIFGTLASLTAGVVGGLISKDIVEKSGKSALSEKGKSAVRNLSTIDQKLSDLLQWTNNSGVNKKEIGRHIGLILLDINSAREDWVDVLPELEEIKQEYEKAQSLMQKYKNDVVKLESQLTASKGKNREVKKKLKVEIEDKKKDIKKLEKEIKSLKERGVFYDSLSARNKAAHGFFSLLPDDNN